MTASVSMCSTTSGQ